VGVRIDRGGDDDRALARDGLGHADDVFPVGEPFVLDPSQPLVGSVGECRPKGLCLRAGDNHV
jgi:hypothetical protein